MDRTKFQGYRKGTSGVKEGYRRVQSGHNIIAVVGVEVKNTNVVVVVVMVKQYNCGGGGKTILVYHCVSGSGGG